MISQLYNNSADVKFGRKKAKKFVQILSSFKRVALSNPPQHTLPTVCT